MPNIGSRRAPCISLASSVAALVVTSSHGMTGPLSDVDAMRANLGLPVDQQHQTLSPAALLGEWQPDGAIWFARATTAPLALALLGTAKPLRAFIGHVEPTFNWTLSLPLNRQVLTDDIKSSIYRGLGLGKPVGLAMSGCYPAIASKLQQYLKAKEEYDSRVGPAAKRPLDMLVYSRVTAHDRASTVILGDPTAAIPLPGH